MVGFYFCRTKRKTDKVAEVFYRSKEKLEDVIQQIVGKCNRIVNESSPIVDARQKMAPESMWLWLQ